MQGKEQEYKENFLAEALENLEEINRLLTLLERNHDDKNTINALFRITHTLKGNASGMGYVGIADLSHVLEDIFDEMRNSKLTLSDELFTSIFKAADVLGRLIESVHTGQDVKYKGIKTKLEVILNRLRGKDKSGVADVDDNNDLRESPLAQQQADEAEEVDDGRISFSDLVQVPVRKLDNLLNLVGELIIEKDRILATQGASGLHASNEFARLSRISSDLQYSVMDVRLVQVGFLFNKFHRVVRDAAASEQKQVALKLVGTDTEIDRNVLQVISDSLIHIIRNCVSHGIELPSDRKAAGKPGEGTIWLGARGETDEVIIVIRDDGKGLNYDKIKAKAIERGLVSQDEVGILSTDQLNMLIFEPGFSTAEQVTAIAGRGVGMDVVKRTIDAIGGTITVLSEPKQGTTVQLRLPSSMAVKSCLLFELSAETYAIPLAYTESVISLYKNQIHKAGAGLMATHLNKTIPVVFLTDVFDRGEFDTQYQNGDLHRSFNTTHPEAKLEIVVVSFNNRMVGLVVDRLLQQKEIVEKPLMRPVEKVKFVGGVTILGSGRVCLVLNIPYLLSFLFGVSASHRTLRNTSVNFN